VTVVDCAERALPKEDGDAARLVQRAMEGDGVSFRCAATIGRMERRAGAKALVVQADSREEFVLSDQVLIAIGRVPNIEGLGLESAGVQYDESGVRVNDRLQTTNRRIYAAGDVCSQYRYTHAADAMARIVVQNALFFGRAKTSRLVMPWTTYTSPALAHVGLYESEAIRAGYRVDTITIPLREVDRALLDGQDDGFFRVHLAQGSDRVLGATLVAEHAGEMISEIGLAMTAGAGLRKVGATIHPYPTQAEVFRKAADQWRRRKLTTGLKRLFELYFRLFG
jgi:pyruvate/2-oxoglutarate dehydrogenase complex dihydrolipoamide dehydrogenase (E3) component